MELAEHQTPFHAFESETIFCLRFSVFRIRRQETECRRKAGSQRGVMLSRTPYGYKVAFRIKNDVDVMIEMLPEEETLDTWTEMLTVQVMRNVNGYTLDSFYAGMKEGWMEMCSRGSVQIIERGHEGLQPTLIWSQICVLNRETGQPENTWFKLSIPNGVLVLVQKAFRFTPTDDDIAIWLDFLRDVRVDHRLQALH
ncbi:hypothetical protein [Shinella zoogloeoides]